MPNHRRSGRSIQGTHSRSEDAGRGLDERMQYSRAVPEGWPARLQCPNCGEWQETSAYLILGKVRGFGRLMHDIVACRRTGCKHFFSPTPEYLALMREGKSALREITAREEDWNGFVRY